MHKKRLSIPITWQKRKIISVQKTSQTIFINFNEHTQLFYSRNFWVSAENVCNIEQVFLCNCILGTGKPGMEKWISLLTDTYPLMYVSEPLTACADFNTAKFISLAFFPVFGYLLNYVVCFVEKKPKCNDRDRQ